MKNSSFERCYLYANGDAVFFNQPTYQRKFSDFDRKKDRKFQSNYSDYRYLSSCAIMLLKMAKNRVIFLTFTFNSKLKINEKDANKIWNNFVKNFKKTYKLQNYLGVLELTKVGTPHYHFLCDYPFVNIKDINASWVNSIRNYYNDKRFDFVIGSVQTPKDFPSVIKDPKRVVKYICKYFTKSIGQHYQSRNYFVSRELRKYARPIELNTSEVKLLVDSFGTVFERKFENSAVKGFEHEVFMAMLNQKVLNNEKQQTKQSSSNELYQVGSRDFF